MPELLDIASAKGKDNGMSPKMHADPRPLRDVAILGGLILLAMVGLFSLASATGWAETLNELKRLAAWHIAVLLLLSIANYLLRGLRWHFFARRLDLRLSLMANLRHFLGGFAMTVTPGRVGELVRLRWIRRDAGVNYDDALPLVVVDRASDVAALALLMGGALVFSASGLEGAATVAILALVAAFVVTRPRLLAALVHVLFAVTGRWPRIFVRARRAARALSVFSKARVLIPSLVIGVIGWFAEAYGFYILLVWMGADIGLGLAIAIFVFAILAGGATGAPGGLGGAEAAMIALLLTAGVPAEIAIPATLIIRATTLWFAIGIGLIIFPFAERKAARAGHVERG